MIKQTKELPILAFKSRTSWRSWLQENHQSKDGVWLVYFKRHTGKPTVSYVDAVEEALCFGWIDGQIRSLDDERYRQRFTPRKPSSNWSVINIDRAKKMIKEGKMTDWGRQVYRKGIKANRIIPSSKNFSIPKDIKKELIGNKKAWAYFQNMAPSAQLAFVYWVDTAKTDETRQKRIIKTIEQLAKNKKFGEV